MILQPEYAGSGVRIKIPQIGGRNWHPDKNWAKLGQNRPDKNRRIFRKRHLRVLSEVLRDSLNQGHGVGELVGVVLYIAIYPLVSNGTVWR
jgi:hypothetical protein